MAQLISTIIPVLNDAAALQRCLAALALCDGADKNEIIVVDGGPSAEVETIAKEFGALYLACERGRAVQMNAAAAHATGEWLWFLHADCVPDAGSLNAIGGLDESAQWGCFRHRIDAPGLAFRVIEWADNRRAKMFALPYGDQGIFVREACFRSAGGYAHVPLLEDVMLAQTLKRLGRPRLLKPVLKCDARRWLERGVWRTTKTNWQIMHAFIRGQSSVEELAARYRQ